ncbi:M48 family metalloprotease [Planosporangium thailandense]|uniref:M48 family metalloprotease n=1 Tax=Planosporangium thailandense TaxID=765197 RepID=A0ABX0XZD1_9ACTN|nr:M48 family metalloprotease [Planosporangium thailandense]NJC71257.1 M48 family metalloprotease [Planosporangium thailandense]
MSVADAGTAPAASPDTADARQRVADIPSGTGMRFLLLVAAVLATSTVIFTWAYLASPGRAQFFHDTIDTCDKRYPDMRMKAATTTEFLERQAPAEREWARCVVPAFQDEAAWVGVQLAAETGLAGVLYALHPWWLRRRRGLVTFDVDNPALAAELRRLCTDVGLDREPAWLLAPFSTGTGGLAFGTRRRRYVSLDAGLLTRWTTDRPAFRAVVLHELAHHRHGDAGRTYATIAVWWAFVAAAVVPYLLFLVHPWLLTRPLSWSPASLVMDWGLKLRVLVALAILTVAVYLIRNAVLRVRETYADAAAAAAAGPDSALARVLGAHREPAVPAWRAPLRTHPTVAQRLAVVADPAGLARTGGWEMFAAGLTGALLAVNLGNLVPNLFAPSVLTGDALICLPVVALLVGLLTIAVWHATARPGPRPWLRRWSLPVALVAGFVAGTPLSLVMSAIGYPLVNWAQPVSLGLLLAGALTVTGYLLSASRSLPDPSGRARRAVLVTAVVAVFPWFLIWFGARGTGMDTALIIGDRPVPGGDIGWYAALAHWTRLLYVPLTELENDSFILPGLALLWAVPAVLSGVWRRRPRPSGPAPIRWAFAVGVGAVAGLAVIGFGIAEPFLARELLPVAIRRTPANVTVDSPPFYAYVAENTYLSAAVVAQGVAAAVTAARSTRLRPSLALLASATTGTVAILGMFAFWTTARCLNVAGNPVRRCRPPWVPPSELSGVYLHPVLIRGVVVAVPATLIGAGLAAWHRRVRGGRAGVARHTARARRPRSAVATTVALGVVFVLVVSAAVVRIPAVYRAWVPADLTGPKCLTGTWVELDHRVDRDFGAAGKARFAGSGAVQTFGADGTAVLDYGSGVTESARLNGHRVQIAFLGHVTTRYRATDERIDYRDVSASGGYAVGVDGRVVGTYPLGTSFTPDQYTCINGYLHENGPGYQILLKRRRG